MFIAVPSDDGKEIASHFGRSLGFVVYEVKGKDVIRKAYRRQENLHHMENGCSCHADHERGVGHHSHIPVLELLQDVDVVISGGLGRKIYEDLVKAGKIVLITDEAECDTVIRLFLDDGLRAGRKPVCGCDH